MKNTKPLNPAMTSIHSISNQNSTGEKIRAMVDATAVFSVTAATFCKLPSKATFHEMASMPSGIPDVEITLPGMRTRNVVLTACPMS